MGSPVEETAARNGQLDSPNLAMVREAFRTIVDQGFEAGLDVLLSRAWEDCEFRPYIANGGVVRGHDAIRAYYREAREGGTDMRLKATSFHEIDGDVVVNGTMRVGRPSGGFSESQISWTYRFRDGRLAAAGWGPRRTI